MTVADKPKKKIKAKSKAKIKPKAKAKPKKKVVKKKVVKKAVKKAPTPVIEALPDPEKMLNDFMDSIPEEYREKFAEATDGLPIKEYLMRETGQTEAELMAEWASPAGQRALAGDHSNLMRQNARHWAQFGKLKLGGGNQFNIYTHLYQEAWLTEKAKSQCFKKGAQIGATEVNVIDSLFGMIQGHLPQGVLYLFPTRNDVTDFSKGRFNPLIEDNKELIGRFVTSTDAANVKRIGKAMLYLRGAKSDKKVEGVKASASQLKSVPVDRIVYDECDEMEPAMIELAEERVSHSLVGEKVYLSTPTIPDYGIDKYYNESDQRVWITKCPRCGRDCCMELDWPDCLREAPNGNMYRACVKCKAEIFPWKSGQWVAQRTDVQVDMVGWWISQLNSSYIAPTAIWNKFQRIQGDSIKLAEFYNSKLGMGYIAAENRLIKNDIYAVCGRDAMPTRHHGPCAMGVDVKGAGNDLHVVIGAKVNRVTLRILKVLRVKTFTEIHDLARRYNVKTAVIDLKPETRTVRKFRDEEPYEIFLADYNENQKTVPSFDSKRGLVQMNRTELCDATHNLVTDTGLLELPRRCEEIERYAKEMCNIAKVLVTDDVTGAQKYLYRKLGQDDYRHATNYFKLASMRVGICEREQSRVTARDAWDSDFDDDYEEQAGYMGA